MKKLERLQAIFKIINETSSKEEIEKTLSALIEFVKQLKTKNKEVIDGLDTKYDDRVKKIEKKLLKEISDFFIQESKKVRNGKDGRDGISPDPTDVASEASKLTLEALKPLVPTIDTLLEKLPEFGEKCRDGLELLKDEDRLDKSAIKGLDELEERLVRLASSKTIMGGGGVGKHNVNVYDLSDKLDGVTKTFSIPSFWRFLRVHSDSFPFSAFKKDIDYTVNGSNNTITFTDQIEASTQLAAGQSLSVEFAE